MSKEEISREKKRQFEADYDEGINACTENYEQMIIDSRMYIGDQWSGEDKAYLTEQQRNIYVYNYIQRNVNMITGNQRKNRLGFGVDPVEQNDEMVADYLNAGVTWQANKSDIYNLISDGFEEAAISGLSLISLSMDYSEDLIEGNVRCNLHPFQTIIIDPKFTRLDLSDCRYIIQRQILSKEEAKGLLPIEYESNIDDLIGGIHDDKFTFLNITSDLTDDNLVTYDEHYRKVRRKVKYTIDRVTDEKTLFTESNDVFEVAQKINPNLSLISVMETGIEFSVFVQGEFFYSGEDPLGINDYPFVPIVWIHKPYTSAPAYKFIGVVRPSRDSQIEYNRNRSQIADLIRSQQQGGWSVIDGAVKNVDDLFKSGNYGVRVINRGFSLDDVRRDVPVEISQSLVALTQQLSTDMLQTSGLNDDAIGVNEAGNQQLSGILAQQRLSNSLTILKGPFDRLEFSQKLLGLKLIKTMLVNYSERKWERITGKTAPRELSMKDLVNYDVVVREAMLTDTQRLGAFQMGLQAMQMGLPIPPAFLMKIYPTPDKAELLEVYEAEAKAKQEQEEALNSQKEINMKLINAEIVHKLSLAEQERQRGVADQMLAVQHLSESEAKRAKATLDNIKAAIEIKGMNQEQLLTALNMLMTIHEQGNAQNVNLAKQTSLESDIKMQAANNLNDQPTAQEQYQQMIKQ